MKLGTLLYMIVITGMQLVTRLSAQVDLNHKVFESSTGDILLDLLYLHITFYPVETHNF